MKLAVVVQRYGADINGGAELHARYIAERLRGTPGRSRDHLRPRLRHVEATRWPAGVEHDQRRTGPALPGAPRARSAAIRPALASGVRAAALDGRRARVARQRRPGEPGADRPPRTHGAGPAITSCFFSYRYYHAWHGARRLRAKAVLVPRPNAIPRSGWRSSGRLFAACAPSCTTRLKSGR